MVAVAVLAVYGVLSGGGQQTSTAHADKPCEFEAGQEYCVDERGEVYASWRGCRDGIDFGTCTDMEGKVAHGDDLPYDVCGNGRLEAPCYYVETAEERQYLKPFIPS